MKLTRESKKIAKADKKKLMLMEEQNRKAKEMSNLLSNQINPEVSEGLAKAGRDFSHLIKGFNQNYRFKELRIELEKIESEVHKEKDNGTKPKWEVW